MSRSYLSRCVTVVHPDGREERHRLAVVRICDDGSLSVTPFERELPGVEYSDTPLTFRCIDGVWQKCE